MNRILSILLFVGAISLVGCMDSPNLAPGAPGASGAPEAAAPSAEAPKDSSIALTGEKSAKIEGQIVSIKQEGKPDMIHFKTSDNQELMLLPSEQLTALLETEGIEQKTFLLEGERVASKDGMSEGFMIKNFEESKAAAKKSEPAKSVAPTNERL